jgi:hypothetical protein
VWFSFYPPPIYGVHDCGTVKLKKPKHSCMGERWEGGGVVDGRVQNSRKVIYALSGGCKMAGRCIRVPGIFW